MSQKIEIGVEAKTSSAEAGIQKVEGAGTGAAEAVSSIGTAADKSGQQLDGLARKVDNIGKTADRAAEAAKRDITYTTERLQRLAAILSREVGRDVSLGDARTAAFAFEKNRSGRGGFKSRLVSGARDYIDYLETSGAVSGRGGRNNSYRRDVIARSLSGTSVASNLPPEEPPNPPGDGGGGGAFQNGVQRTQSMAMAFGKSMLALAGISSVAAMAAQAVDMATEEAITLDTLKRRAGDLGVSFDHLQDQTRAASEGMGLTFVESARLAQQYAKVSGQLASGPNLRTSYGFSRSFGADPSEGVQFFGTMQRLRVSGADEQGSRRLALMIGEAVSKSGYSSKVDEVLGSIANFADGMARVTLSAPNVGDYAGYFTSLMRSGYVGTSPENSAAILAAADQATRRGGGMGDASMNFMYAALRNGTPGGLDIFQASALMQGGLFATTKGTFSKGTPLGDMFGKSVPKSLDDITNLQKLMMQMDKLYAGNPRAAELETDAIKNTFGLQSYAQAAAFYDMYRRGPTALNDTMKLVTAAGLDPMRISATGISGLTKVAGVHDIAGAMDIYTSLRSRRDITMSDKERGDVEGAIRSGNVEAAREALARIIGTHEQEKTPGSETRDAIADLKNELTRVGGLLIGPINDIKTAVVATAEALAPAQYRMDRQRQKDAATDFHAEYAKGRSTAELDSDIARTKQRIDDMRRHGMKPDIDSIAPRPNPSWVGYSGMMSMFNTPGAYNYDMAKRQAVAKYLGDAGAMAPDAWRKFMSETDSLLGLPGGTSARQIYAESSFRPGIDHPSSGAMGLAQVMPGTLAQLSKRLGRQLDPHNPSDALLIHRLVLQDKLRAEHGNIREALLDYGGFVSPEKRNSAEARAYLGKILGNTPMPEGGKPKDDTSGQMRVGFDHAEVTVKDTAGKHIGSAKLKPFVSGPASGAGGVAGFSPFAQLGGPGE